MSPKQIVRNLYPKLSRSLKHITTLLALHTLQKSHYPFAGARAIIKVSSHQCQWLAGGYDLEIGHF